MAASLDQLPTELVARILYFVPPESALASVRPLSRRFRAAVDQPLLWRFYCRASWRHWSAEHRLADRLAAPAAAVDWKALWLLRRGRDARAARGLARILHSRRGSLDCYADIAGALGYDAKDYLLAQCRVPDDDAAGDALARRYYAALVLSSIHRAEAIAVWDQCLRNADAPRTLERALGAFDLFVLHDQPHDLDYITRTLDKVASQFQRDHALLHEMSTREKALALARWLRAQGLMGDAALQSTINYRHLQNCLIGHALADERHPSLPVISTAIFCCVAERLGLAAHCALIPGHVHVMVKAPPGMTLNTRVVDGRRREGRSNYAASALPHEAKVEKKESVVMYLNPWMSEEEVDVADLQSHLASLGELVPPRDFARFQARPAGVVMRVVANIEATHQFTSVDLRANNRGLSITDLSLLPTCRLDLARLPGGRVFPRLNMAAAKYACSWARALLVANADGLLLSYAGDWAHDTWLISKHLVGPPDHARCDVPCGWITQVRKVYDMPPRPPCPREFPLFAFNLCYVAKLEPEPQQPEPQQPGPEAGARFHLGVCFRRGQVVRHRRYGYVGVVIWQHRPKQLQRQQQQQQHSSARTGGSRAARRSLGRRVVAGVADDDDEDEDEAGADGGLSTAPRAGAWLRCPQDENWYACLFALTTCPRPSSARRGGIERQIRAAEWTGPGGVHDNSSGNDNADEDADADNAWIERFRTRGTTLEAVTDPSVVLALPPLVEQAGQFFRRFDAARCQFV